MDFLPKSFARSTNGRLELGAEVLCTLFSQFAFARFEILI
jgi:hypothetical protein